MEPRRARDSATAADGIALTVHRALADPRAGGRPTFTRLHDVILERLPRPCTARACSMPAAALAER